ncbi:MAG: HAD-IIIA family hydrolase [Polyangiaceae bacterium]
MSRLAIVDRDGTIIDFYRDAELGVVTPAFHPDQLRFLPGALDGLSALSRAGFAIAIATNQPGAAKGELPVAAIERTQRALVERLEAAGIPIAGSFLCMHHPSGGDGGVRELVSACSCRKPEPGLLLAALEATSTSAAAAWMIGDTLTDVRAARAARVHAALVSPTERCELCPHRFSSISSGGERPDVHAARLDLAAELILRASI